MTAPQVLQLVDIEAYRHWQQHIIYEKNRKGRTSADAADSNDGVSDGNGSAPTPDADDADATADDARDEIRARQRVLIDAVAQGPAALSQYLLRTLRVTDTTALRDAVPLLPNPLTAAAMQRLPRYDEEKIAESLHDVLSAEAATPVFWTACHAVWIEQGYFDDLVASFLEGPGTRDDEARARNFLRRTGGLERVRGKVSVLVNCPIAMAWWRVRTAREIAEVSEDTGVDFSTAHELLHDPTIWAELTGLSVKRLTSLNAPRARAAAMVALVERGTIGNEVRASIKKTRCQGALRAVGRLSHSFSLNTTPWQTLLESALIGIDKADNSQLDPEPADLADTGNAEAAESD